MCFNIFSLILSIPEVVSPDYVQTWETVSRPGLVSHRRQQSLAGENVPVGWQGAAHHTDTDW